MAYWYTKFLAEQFQRDDLKDAEFCVLAEIGKVLNVEHYRDLKKAEFNKLLLERIKGHMRTDLKPRKSWLKKAAKQSADKGSAGKEPKLPDAKIESVYMRNFRSFGDGIQNDESERKGTTLQLIDSVNSVLSRAIFFGPNGSGKSSLCESLELKITDYIVECDRRGITLSKFCHRHSCPHDPEVIVKLNPNKAMSPEQKRLAKSCFIEKNRIQDFALMAKGKGDKDIIALLIGLADVKTIADEIMVLPASCSLAHDENLLSDAKDALATWKTANLEIEKQIAVGKTNEADSAKELTTILQVNPDLCDTIAARSSEYRTDIAKYKDVKEKLDEIQLVSILKKDLAEIFRTAIDGATDRTQLEARLATQGSNVNYKELYVAVTALGAEGATACPACDTPLADVTSNPFEKATSELPKLKELQEIQEALTKNASVLMSVFRRITAAFDQFCRNEFSVVQHETISIPQIHDLITASRAEHLPYVKMFNDLSDQQEVATGVQSMIDLMRVSAGKVSADIDHHDAFQSSLKKERDRIDDLRSTAEKKLYDLTQRHETWKKARQILQQAMRKHQLNMKRKSHLENEERVEVEKNEFLKECNKAYATIHKRFLDFKHSLERERTETIQQHIAHYYQMINAGDSDVECVESVVIQIPDGSKSEYAILLNCKDGEQKNAMHVLSEGHVRALGLSIMLAVAEKYDLPFLIFDDAVNAIDSDHRANIIDMMFEDAYLCRTQLIVTTHDRLFWERFCLELGKTHLDEKVAAGASFIVTYPANGHGSVFAQYSVDFEHKITAALANYDLRQAMIYSRIWLETEVLNYIDAKGERLSGRLHKSRKFRGNALEPDIKGMFAKMTSLIAKTENGAPVFEQSVKDAWSFLCTELVDDVINQDNHAYSESMLNVSHAKTSDEVQKIFEQAKIVVTAINPKRRLPAIAAPVVKQTTKKLAGVKNKATSAVS